MQTVTVVTAHDWVDYVTTAAALLAGAAALAALYFAWRASRDVVHDRRDTFELELLRGMLEELDRIGGPWPPFDVPTLRRLRRLRRMFGSTTELPVFDRFIAKVHTLGLGPGEGDSPSGRGRNGMLEDVRQELLLAIDMRTGRRRRIFG